MHWDPLFEQYHLADYFDGIYASHHLHMAKPSKEIFDYVVRDAKIDSAHTIYVDDLDKNRAAGERYAGWTTCESVEQLKKSI